jgi:hypothetical protein
VILTSLAIDRAAFAARTGWALKPEGACRGDICVPLPDQLDATVLSERLGMPLLHDEGHGVWALGPATAAGRTLATAEFPAVALPDIRTGAAFDFASLRGTKVLLLAWASW